MEKTNPLLEWATFEQDTCVACGRDFVRLITQISTCVTCLRQEAKNRRDIDRQRAQVLLWDR